MKLLVAGTATSGPQRSGITTSLFSCASVEFTLFTSATRLMSRPEAITEYKQCLSALIPMAQKAQLEYLKNPGPLNKSIEELVKAEKTFWEVDQPSMQYAVDVMNNDGLVGNGPSGVYGEFDKDRINRLIKEYAPVMEKSGRKVPDVTADDLVTNEFLDPTIKFTK